MPDKFQKFQRALRDMQVQQWLTSQHAGDWRSSDADDLRQFAEDVKALNAAYDAFLRAGCALVGADADLDDCPDTISDFVHELRQQADALDEVAREPAAVWSPKLQEYV